MSDLLPGLIVLAIGGSIAPPLLLVNDDAGGRTQLAGIVAAASVVVFLLLFTPLLQSLPTGWRWRPSSSLLRWA